MPGRGYRTSAAGILAALVVLTTAVAGCDAHSKPTVLKEPSQTPAIGSPSASPSSASSATPSGSPSLPAPSPSVGVGALNSAYPSAVAAEPAAIQVVRDFFDGMNRETDTGDETAVSKVIYSTCSRCINGVVSIKNLLDGGHTIRGGHVHLLSVDDVTPTAPNIVTVIVTNSEDAGQQLESNGHVVQSFAAVPPKQLIFDVLVDQTPPVIGQLSLGSS